MTRTAIALLIVATVAIATIAIRVWLKSRTYDQAAGVAQEVFPVWAAQGPFSNGSESAIAMRYAWLAVFGDSERVDSMAETFSEHAKAFDSDPEVWEQNRVLALEKSRENVSEYLAEVQRLRALNTEISALVSEVMKGSECSELEWSNNPGAYEAQLIRRCGNPYFPESLQDVSNEELSEAKKIDNDDYILVEEHLTQLEKEIDALPSTLLIGDLHKLRERVDDLISFSMGVGGHAYEIASKADQIREALISTMRAAFRNDEETLLSIEKADTFHKKNVKKFDIPVMAQMLRERSPIKQEHTIATILSEDPETIALVLSVMSEEGRAVVELEALKMMKEALNEGYIDKQFEEKISTIEGSK